MKNSHKVLLSVGAKMAHKYASIDASTIQESVKNALWQSIANASNRKDSGIQPFIKMLQADQAAMNISITRNGDTIEVSPPFLDKGAVAPKYHALSSQIQNWLTKNLEVFPTKRNGESVNYNNLTVTLQYPNSTTEPIASQ